MRPLRLRALNFGSHMPSIIITGMHRSHTSLVAEGFHDAGLFLGDPMIGATSANAHGHFEAEVVVDFHQNIIIDQGLKSWWRFLDRDKSYDYSHTASFRTAASEVLSHHFDQQLYGWKDPRAPFFLEGWHDVLPDSYYIFVIRRPAECVYSLNRRSLKNSRVKWRPYLTTRHFNLWDDTNSSILSFVRQHPDRCLLIHALEDLLNVKAVDYLNDTLQNKWKLELNTVSWDTIYDPALVKSAQVPTSIERIGGGRTKTKKLYDELLDMSIGNKVNSFMEYD